MTPSKPSVTRAFAREIAPRMTDEGFVRINPKLYARLVDDWVLQFLSIHVETGLRRQFRLEYGAMFLGKPHEHWTLQPGGTAKHRTSGGVYGASSERNLEVAMNRVAEAYEVELAPWFRSSSSVVGFSETLDRFAREHSYLLPSGHIEFTRACVASVRGEEARARTLLSHAAGHFENAHPSWGETCLSRCSALLEALDRGRARELHEDWRRVSVSNLGVERLREVPERDRTPDRDW